MKKCQVQMLYNPLLRLVSKKVHHLVDSTYQVNIVMPRYKGKAMESGFLPWREEICKYDTLRMNGTEYEIKPSRIVRQIQQKEEPQLFFFYTIKFLKPQPAKGRPDSHSLHEHLQRDEPPVFHPHPLQRTPAANTESPLPLFLSGKSDPAGQIQ